jgi:hypothetical protein
MTALETPITESILAVHNSLWNALYDFDSDIHSLHYNDIQYNIYLPKHRGYASVNLPNPKGTQFLWITQNLNKSTYGTLQIQKARQRNEDQRITWIVDTSNGQFEYRTSIRTTASDTGELIQGSIDMYDSLGTETVWSTNPLLITQKAKF